jgi:rubrerythrin
LILEELMKLTDITPDKALELASTIEEKAAQHYAALAKKFADDEPLAAVFSQLAEDEAAHENHFKDLSRRMGKPASFEGREEALNLLRASAASEFFHPESLSRTDDIRTPADALHKALGLEKATLFFYQSLKDVLDVSEEVNHLIETEKRHISSLMKVLISDARFRSLDDTW